MSRDHRTTLRPQDRQGNEARWREWQDGVREMAAAAFAAGKGVEIVAREKKRNRSLAQNRLAHMWFNEIAEFVREHHGQAYPAEAFKEWLKATYLGQEVHTMPNGQVVAYTRHTSDLSVEEFTHFLEQVDAWAAQDLGCQLTHPEDLYEEAMGRFRDAA
jgi:hypothetical protein